MYYARSKVTIACKNCQQKKVKCSGPPMCDKCQEKNLHCHFNQRQRKRGPRPRVKQEINESHSSRILRCSCHPSSWKLINGIQINNDQGYSVLNYTSVGELQSRESKFVD